MSLEKLILEKVNERVYRKFPEVNGKKPSVQTRPGDQFLLLYQGEVDLGSGLKMKRVVRAVVDHKGKIIKITTSR